MKGAGDRNRIRDLDVGCNNNDSVTAKTVVNSMEVMHFDLS
jgi:hypothetical protein